MALLWSCETMLAAGLLPRELEGLHSPSVLGPIVVLHFYDSLLLLLYEKKNIYIRNMYVYIYTYKRTFTTFVSGCLYLTYNYPGTSE